MPNQGDCCSESWKLILKRNSLKTLPLARSFDKHSVLTALRKSWSKSSAKQWKIDNPALGQCNVTALLIHEMYGGELLKTPLPDGSHYYNRVNGERIDLTSSQFNKPIVYADIPTNRREVEYGVTNEEYKLLKSTFVKHISTKS